MITWKKFMKGMSELYNVPPIYPYPFYVDESSYSPSLMMRNPNNQQVLGALLDGMKAEASAIDLFSRLAYLAPDHEHRNVILHALEDKKKIWRHFTDTYISLSGTQPFYQIDQVTFNSYRDGLEKAYEAELNNCDEYRNHYLLTQNTPISQLFFQAYNDEKLHAAWFGHLRHETGPRLEDQGGEPFVIDIEEAAVQNETFRTAIWTGNKLQVTVMSIDAGDDIGLEVHETGDQFIRVEEGEALVQMGDSKDNLTFEANVSDDFAIMIPEGKWHNVTNIGDKKLKVYVIYAPPEHPFGTVHETKADAMAAED
jgi:mannose-6-phosphate isomerase-like protein (cupin superfamily)